MSRETAVLAGRTLAESGMTDECSVTYRSGESFNATTGKSTPAYTTRFTTKCKFSVGGLGSLIPTSKDDPAAGRITTELRIICHFPVSAPPIEPDDVLVVTDVGPSGDEQLLGRRLRVVAPIAQTWGTARRFSVEEQLA